MRRLSFVPGMLLMALLVPTAASASPITVRRPDHRGPWRHVRVRNLLTRASPFRFRNVQGRWTASSSARSSTSVIGVQRWNHQHHPAHRLEHELRVRMRNEETESIFVRRTLENGDPAVLRRRASDVFDRHRGIALVRTLSLAKISHFGINRSAIDDTEDILVSRADRASDRRQRHAPRIRVPEPASLLLMGTGIATLAGRRLRRKSG